MRLNKSDLVWIQDMIASGMSNAEIADAVNDEMESRAIEAAEYAEYYADQDRPDDGLSSGQREYNDRLDMGRNEAGEWLGFM